MEIEYFLSQYKWLLTLHCPWPHLAMAPLMGPQQNWQERWKQLFLINRQKTAEKNVLEKTFQPFFLQCHKGGGFWQVQLLPNTLHKEARDITVVGDIICPSTIPPAFSLSSELIYVLLLHCWQAWCHLLHAHMPAQCQLKFTQPSWARSASAWPCQEQNCQGTLKQMESPNLTTVQ